MTADLVTAPPEPEEERPGLGKRAKSLPALLLPSHRALIRLWHSDPKAWDRLHKKSRVWID